MLSTLYGREGTFDSFLLHDTSRRDDANLPLIPAFHQTPAINNFEAQAAEKVLRFTVVCTRSAFTWLAQYGREFKLKFTMIFLCSYIQLLIEDIGRGGVIILLLFVSKRFLEL